MLYNYSVFRLKPKEKKYGFTLYSMEALDTNINEEFASLEDAKEAAIKAVKNLYQSQRQEGSLK